MGQPVAVRAGGRGRRQSVCPQTKNCKPCHLSVRDTYILSAQEYAAGGELFERIIEAGRLPEAEARFFFQQLISGIAYCHKEARQLAVADD